MNCEVKSPRSVCSSAGVFRHIILLTIVGGLLPASVVAQSPEISAGNKPLVTPLQATEADNGNAEKAIADNNLQIAVERVRLQSRTGLESVHGQVELLVKITNTAADGITSLADLEWSMTCNDKPCTLNRAIQNALTTSDIALQSGKSRDGWLAFTVNQASAVEPLLSFSWTNGSASETIDINETIRTTSKLKTIRIGPEDCLAVVELHRPMDHISTWLLSAEFEAIKKQNIEFVVLDLKPEVSEMAPTYSLRRALDSWLISVQKGSDAERFNFRTQVRSAVQFTRFFAAGAESKSSPRVINSSSILSSRTLYGAAGSVFCDSREHAIASALMPVYEQLSVDEALRGLSDAEPGIQRVALETNIDRLTETQLTNVIDRAMRGTPAQQALVAENLHRVTLRTGTARLSELVRSSNVDVSQAALRSLVSSVSPEAAIALKGYWRESNQNEAVRQDIVMAIMGAKDYRHLDLLMEFAEEYVTGYFESSSREIAKPQDVRKVDADTRLQMLIAAQNQARSATVTAPHALVLENVLNFLRDQGETGFADFARCKLMEISDYGVQDVVMKYILANLTGGDEQLVERYIGQRLPSTMTGGQLTREQTDALTQSHGPRIVTRNSRISDTLIGTIRKFPSSEYTDRLIELSESSAVASSLRSNAFQAAVRCATDEQLTSMIARFDSLKEPATTHLLTQLAALQHPDWMRIAKESLELTDRESLHGVALALLRNDGSVESTLIIVNHLEDIRSQSEKDGKASSASAEKNANRLSSLKAQRRLQRVIQTLTLSTLPEARRAINRCGRSDDEYVAQQAYLSIRSFHSTNPNRQDVVEAYKLKTEKDYAGALAVYNKVLERDPFYASGYVSRASLKLRDSHAEAAMEDLKQAEELDPENALIESLIALTDIRLGNVEKGVQRSDEIMASIPDLPTRLRTDTIYNTACAYGRAAEATAEKAEREAYLDRGIELLKQSIHRKLGFDDVQHALNDPDLNAFHEHAEWNSVLEQVGENEKKRPQP